MISPPRDVKQRILDYFDGFQFAFGASFWRSFGKGMLLGLAVLVIGGYGAFRIAYQQKSLPGLRVAGIDVSGLSASDTVYVLEGALSDYIDASEQITLSHNTMTWQMPLAGLGLKLDKDAMRVAALAVGRSGPWWRQLPTQWQMVFGEGAAIPLALSLNTKQLEDFVATASAQINNPAIPPRVYVGERYNPATQSLVVVEPGTPGEIVDQNKTLLTLKDVFFNLATPDLPLTTDYVSILADETQLADGLARAKKLLDHSLQLYFEDESTGERLEWTLSGSDLISFLSVTSTYDLPAMDSYIALLANSINRPAQNALFQFDEVNNRVSAFKPAKKGLAIQTDRLSLAIRQGMEQLLGDATTPDIEIAAYQTDPLVDTGSVNELGIETLLGRGESTYFHSSAARQHNVELTASKLNGTLVPPGKTFSFNEALGEVTVQTGFLQAFVIRDGRTILGDGGGVCQDSTTLFRAVLNAGLPITGWQNHSYRVGYYEQNSKPGFDATVYSPSPDFRFTNDTPNYILIQTKAEGMELVYELYGTDDGRQATVTNYAQWDASAPPPDLHQDDPSLPLGTVKKVESAVPGLKTKFDYTVTRNGEVVFAKTFMSVFRPWQAVYLHGTKQ